MCCVRVFFFKNLPYKKRVILVEYENVTGVGEVSTAKNINQYI